MSAVYKINGDFYPGFQQAVDRAFYGLLHSGKGAHVFPPEMEPAKDGYVYLNVKEWIANLEGMDRFLSELTEVE